MDGRRVLGPLHDLNLPPVSFTNGPVLEAHIMRKDVNLPPLLG